MDKLLKSLCAVVLFASAAQAIPIAIDNPSFEDPALADGTALTGRNSGCPSNPAPWDVGPPCSGFGNSLWQTVDPDGDSTGVMNPTVGPLIVGSTSTSPNFAFLPDGDQVAYSNGGTFFQILPVTIEANTTYTLSFWAGARQDVGFSSNGGAFFYSENQGYFAELSGGTDWWTRTPFVRTVAFKPGHGFGVSSLNAPDAPVVNAGEWIQVIVSFTIGASDPLIGQQLIVAFGAPAVQSGFDMVTLDAVSTTVPEPASLALMGAGLGFLAFRNRRKRLAK